MYKVYLVGYILFKHIGVHSNNLLQKSNRMCFFLIYLLVMNIMK